MNTKFKSTKWNNKIVQQPLTVGNLGGTLRTYRYNLERKL